MSIFTRRDSRAVLEILIVLRYLWSGLDVCCHDGKVWPLVVWLDRLINQWGFYHESRSQIPHPMQHQGLRLEYLVDPDFQHELAFPWINSPAFYPISLFLVLPERFNEGKMIRTPPITLSNDRLRPLIKWQRSYYSRHTPTLPTRDLTKIGKIRLSTLNCWTNSCCKFVRSPALSDDTYFRIDSDDWLDLLALRGIFEWCFEW